MNFLRIIPCVFLCICLLYSCKKSEPDMYIAPTENRIKTITGYNSYNEAQSKIEFNYANNKVLGWLYLTKNDNEEWNESKRMNIDYNGNNVSATLQHKQNDSWITKQICTFLIIENQIHEKTISRTVFPACSNCWKYYYKYAGSQLVEWEKHTKDENNSWEVIEKMEYLFKEQKLKSRNNYLNSDHTGLKLDYIRNYFYRHMQLAGWLSGICIEGKDWLPTEKVEYTYKQDKVVAHDFLVWNANEETWQQYGSVTYGYNSDGYLVEENTSESEKTVYEYEPGSGNTSVLFYDPDCFIQLQPMLKSAVMTLY